MSEWQPIETAPRESTGTVVTTPRLLLWVPPYGPLTGFFTWGFDQSSGSWSIPGLLNKEAEPTHWMPLPEPPAKGDPS